MAQTLFEKYGRFSSFQQLTRDFYTKVLDSQQLKHYFISVDMERLIDHQTRFLCYVLGGPKYNFDEKALVQAHANLGISHSEFDEVVELLSETLEDAGVQSEDLKTIVHMLESYRGHIVNA